MAQKLGNLAVGSIVKINENGSPVEYIVVNQGNPDSRFYNGADGTWVRRKDIVTLVQFGQTLDDGDFSRSYIHSWGDNTMFQWFSPNMQKHIHTVTIPNSEYGFHGPESVTAKIFPPLQRELGIISSSVGNTSVGICLAFYTSATDKTAQYNGENCSYWTRGYANSYKGSIVIITGDNMVSWTYCENKTIGFLPFMVVDSDLTVLDDGTIGFYDIPSLTVPDMAMTGQSIPLSWGAAEEATTYVLERKADTDEDWVQLYSGANLSYTDTAGSWTSVQYRVKAGAGSDFGDYTTSKSIPVVSASALVISGEDEDLGTITGDLTYTVTSDTGNPITLERRVNGKLVAKGTVNSGFSYPISVFDLPTGAGTIELSALVTSGSAQVTATRTWTYTKTPVTFPEAGGPAQLAQGGQNVFPATIAEAVRTTTALGGTLDKTLELLAPLLNSAVIYVGTYTGTGTFGADNPSTLTFDSAPSIVTIYGGGKTLAISSTDTEGTAYIDGTSAKWYADTAENQLNVSGTTYSYIAIGEVTES